MTHVGDNGLAVSMKIATNLSLAVQMLAFSEAVLLAEKSGIARKTAVEVLTNSVIASPMVQYRGPMVLQMPDEAWFDMKMMQKDMTLALEMGRRLAVPLPTTAVANEFLTAARGMGLTEEGFRRDLPGAGPDVRSPRMTATNRSTRPWRASTSARTSCSGCIARWWRSACSRSGSTISTRAR